MGLKSDLPSPPVGARAAGKRLWAAVVAVYQLEEHELSLLREACRAVDVLDQLDAAVRRDGVLGPDGRAHPAVVEGRQQRIGLARVLGALRLPAGDEGDEQKGARRPQRRVGARGVYAIGRRSS